MRKVGPRQLLGSVARLKQFIMKKKVCFFIVSLLLVSCNKTEKMNAKIISKVEAIEIEKLLNENIPNPIESHRIFVFDKDDYLHSINYGYLKSVYPLNYSKKYSSLSIFIYEVVNQKLKLRSEDFDTKSEKCSVSETITNDYKTKGVDYLLEHYCMYNKEKNKFLLIKNNLSYCEIQALGYFLFINNYEMQLNDYSGEVSFSKASQTYNTLQ